MELCLGRGAAPRPPEDGSAQSPLSEVLGVSEPTSVWSPCRALPRPSRRLFLSLAACVLVRGSPPPWLPLQQEPVAASGPGAGAGSGKEAGGGNSGLTWGMSCLAPGWLRGVSFSHTLLHTCLSQRAAASWDFFPSFFFFFFFLYSIICIPGISFGMTGVVLRPPAHSWCPGCGCVWNCQKPTVPAGPGLLDSIVGVRGSLSASPALGRKAGRPILQGRGRPASRGPAGGPSFLTGAHLALPVWGCGVCPATQRDSSAAVCTAVVLQAVA